MESDSAAVSITVSDLGISDFIFVSRELLMVSRPTLRQKIDIVRVRSSSGDKTHSK